MAGNQIFTTQDGSHSVFSQAFGVSYHSKYGAIQESRHVFLEAGLFYLMPRHTGEITLLEMGLGTGLNALLTLLAAGQYQVKIRYTAYELNPLTPDEADSLNYPHILKAEPGTSFFRQIHQAEWKKPAPLTPFFELEKINADFRSLQDTNRYDLVYYDAFAPEAQPELWTEATLRKVADALKPNGVLVTYCAKGALKRTLKSLGLTVESIQGPPGKREMTRAVKQSP